MRKLIFSAWALLLIGSLALAQDATAVKYGNTITPEDMRAKLTVLASDDFGGRETGTEGQKKASRFLEDFYKKIGLAGPVDGTYRQKFSLYQADWSEVYINNGKGKKMNGDEFIFLGNADMDKEMRLNTVFVGKVTEDTDFSAIADKGVVVVGANRNQLGKLREEGAKAIFVVNENDERFKQMLPRQARSAIQGRMTFDNGSDAAESIVFYVTQQLAADLLKVDTEEMLAAIDSPSDVKERKVRFQVKKNINEIATENMVAFLEGTDLKDEVLVISSHFDHIGQNEDGTVINNGADDDGSGTTGVMEIAEAFAQAAQDGVRPRRSILFINVTGEEKGLLGSAYYADNPLFPIEKTVNNLNIDMIGRVDPEHEESGNRDYVYVIGSEKLSSHLKVISEYANITYTGLDLDYRFDDPDDRNRFYYRSDHYNFAKKGIPIIFYFNGVHPDYHRPTDTVDKITFDVMAKRAQLVFHTAWILANRDERTPVDKEDDMEYNR